MKLYIYIYIFIQVLNHHNCELPSGKKHCDLMNDTLQYKDAVF